MARQFLEDRLNVEIGFGSSFNETYAVTNTQDSSRDSYGKLIDPRPEAQCELIFQNRAFKFTLMQVVDLFHRSGGTFGGFRVKDYLNFSTNNYIEPPTEFDQRLRVTAVPGVYQITRWYGEPSGATPRRLIKKPVPGSVKVAKNGVLMSTGWTVDTATGLITFVPLPEPGDVLTAGCYFDMPMRFMTNLTGLDITDKDMVSTSVSLIEILNP